MFGLLYNLGLSIYATFSSVWDWFFIELRFYNPLLEVLDYPLVGDIGFVDKAFVGFVRFQATVFQDFIVDDYFMVFRPIDAFLGLLTVLLLYRIVKWVLDIVL